MQQNRKKPPYPEAPGKTDHTSYKFNLQSISTGGIITYAIMGIILLLAFVTLWPLSVPLGLILSFVIICLNSYIGLMHLGLTIIMHISLFMLYPEHGDITYTKDVLSILIAYGGPLIILGSFFIALDQVDIRSHESYRLKYLGVMYTTFSVLSALVPTILFLVFIYLNTSGNYFFDKITPKYRDINIYKNALSIKSLWGKLTLVSIVLGQAFLLWSRVESFKKKKIQ